MTISGHEIERVYAMGFQSGAATMYATLRPAGLGEEAMSAGRHVGQMLVNDLGADDGFRPRFMEAVRRALAGEPPADEVRPVRSTEGDQA